MIVSLFLSQYQHQYHTVGSPAIRQKGQMSVNALKLCLYRHDNDVSLAYYNITALQVHKPDI